MGDGNGRFAICIKNEGYLASLEPRKIYRVLTDAAAESKGMLRVIDETGEDYLFPAVFFVPVEVPAEASIVFAER